MNSNCPRKSPWTAEGDQMKAEAMEDISFARFKKNNTNNIKEKKK